MPRESRAAIHASRPDPSRVVIAVVVPVLRRPHRAEPLADSLTRATTVPYRLVFVCSPDDRAQIAACQGLGDVLTLDRPPGPADYSLKIQAGYDATTEPFVFTGADDLDFQPGWDEAALAAAEAYNAGVIGTNDGANPKVKRGEHATHSLVRRAYVEECGGCLEGPGVLYSPAYSHGFVDNELVELADSRGCWVFAADSHVTHRHPFWGTAPMDETYRRAQADSAKDRALFQQRRKQWARR